MEKMHSEDEHLHRILLVSELELFALGKVPPQIGG